MIELTIKKLYKTLFATVSFWVLIVNMISFCLTSLIILGNAEKKCFSTFDATSNNTIHKNIVKTQDRVFMYHTMLHGLRLCFLDIKTGYKLKIKPMILVKV